MKLKLAIIPDFGKCLSCDLLDGATDECMLLDDDMNSQLCTFQDLKDSCPLIDIPEKFEVGEGSSFDFERGWNACIDKILNRATVKNLEYGED